jgi:uncharacterized paraquat-inducible protein A
MSVIRAVYDMAREKKALEAWRARYSLATRLEVLRLKRPEAYEAFLQHLQRWGYRVEARTCDLCGGVGHIDDIFCPRCDATGVR